MQREGNNISSFPTSESINRKVEVEKLLSLYGVEGVLEELAYHVVRTKLALRKEHPEQNVEYLLFLSINLLRTLREYKEECSYDD